jgi:hypothetical protein
MTTETVVDALPYYDSGYDESGVKEAALALIEEECRRYRPTKNYLDIFAPVNYHAFEVNINFYYYYLLNKKKCQLQFTSKDRDNEERIQSYGTEITNGFNKYATL